MSLLLAARRAGSHRAMVAILIVALLFRLGMATQPTVHQPDEIWQYLEPAYGWVTGRWIAAWEFHSDIRGWLIPALFYPLVALGQWLAPTTQLHVLLVRMALAVLSMGVVFSFARIAGRISRDHALIAAWVCAIWVEIFFFAGRSSGEAMAVSLIVPSLAIGYRLKERPSSGWAALAGLLLALATVMRFQYVPIIAMIGLWMVWPAPRRLLLPVICGGIGGIVLGGLADLAAGHTPYLWIWNNFAINLGENRSALFGTQPWWWFITTTLRTWNAASLLLLPSIVMGARRFPFLLILALAVLAIHMPIPHKEYRFILLAIVLLLLLGGVGSLDLVRRLLPGLRSPVPLLCALWFALSVLVAAVKPFSSFWGSGRSASTSLIEAGERPGFCGLAIYRARAHPLAAASLINRDAPVLLIDGENAKAAVSARKAAFNTVIAPRLAGQELPVEYRLIKCQSASKPPAEQRYCTYVRPGPCSGGASDYDYNLVLNRLGH